jgi:hypothetical protein
MNPVFFMSLFLWDRGPQPQVTKDYPILVMGIVNVYLEQGDLANPELDLVLAPSFLLRLPAVNDRHDSDVIMVRIP